MQRFALDLRFRGAYIGTVVLAAVGCRPAVAPLAPSDLGAASAAQVDAWVRSTVPSASVRYDVRWSFHQEGSSVGGRGAVRLAPPDSLRLDFQGPLGLGAGSAVVLGREVRWAEPERNFRELVRAVPLLWATLGVAVPPAMEEALAGHDGPRGVLWRYAAGADTLAFLNVAAEPRFTGELRQAGRLVGRATVMRDPTTGLARSARLELPTAHARLELEFLDAVHESFPAGTWSRTR